MDRAEIEKLIETLEQGRLDERLPVGQARSEDIAQALGGMDDEARDLILGLLDDEKAAEVLAASDENVQEDLAERIPRERLVRLLDEMDPDDAADIVAYVPEEAQATVLSGLEREHGAEVRQLQRYEPESAGGVMTTDVVAVESSATARDALMHVGEADQPEVIGTIFVTDAGGSLLGVVSLKDLLTTDLETPVGTFMDADVISVGVDEDQEEAARLVDHYGLTSIPVVDAAGHLKGVITVDDIIDVLEEEASEDMMRMAGTAVTHPMTETLMTRLRARAPWLSITLGGTFMAGLLLEFIERTWFPSQVDQLVGAVANVGGDKATAYKMLLYYIPLIGGMAGNVGTQSSTIMVRGFATGEVDPNRPGRVLGDEMILALMIGVLSGLAVGVLVAMTHPAMSGLGVIVGVALPCAILCAAAAGTLVPFACHKIKVDPAYAAGPFLLTLNDLAAYVIYFWVAVSLMSQLSLVSS